MKRLGKNFFIRSTVDVARDLIGCYLVRNIDGRIEKYLITETEAYDGPDDLASHASKGRTPRTEIMFGPAGRYYVYLVYGLHWMLNIVTGPADYPAAVLIRGISGYHGPAKLTKKLGITGSLNGKPVSTSSRLWIEAPGIPIATKKIRRFTRIGIDYAGSIWAKKKWRFVLASASL